MKYIYILFLLFDLLSCHNADRVDNKDTPPLYCLKIDKPDFSSLKPMLLSEFVDSIGYVQLETTPDCLLPYDRSGIIYGDFLFMVDLFSILQFDANTGKFLRQIGRKGQGPGEYVQVNEAIDKDNNIVYVKSPNRSSSLLSYNFNGDYLGDLQFVDDPEYPTFSNCFYSLRLVYIDNQYAIFTASFMPKEQACQPFELIVYDYRNKKIKHALANDMEGVYNRFSVNINGLRTISRNDDGFYYKTFYNDTLYSVDVEKGIEPYAIIDLGTRKYPVDDIFDNRRVDLAKVGKILINSMLINDDCIYLELMFINDGSLRSVSGFLYKFDINTGESSYHSTVILNDIDGGKNTSIRSLLRETDPITPLDMVEEGKEELVFSNVSKSKLKYPELKDKFDMMQSKRDPDDNPLLMKFYMEN